LPEGMQVEVLSLARVYADDAEEHPLHASMAARLNLR
jgi:hypothetical protein